MRKTIIRSLLLLTIVAGFSVTSSGCDLPGPFPNYCDIYCN